MKKKFFYQKEEECPDGQLRGKKTFLNELE